MITICTTSDLHGRLDRFKAYAEEMKAIKPDVLIDNGDFWQGSLTSFYYEYVIEKSNPMFQVANEIGLDMLVFGNHEFNEPLDKMAMRRQQSQFPWISCNIGALAKPYIIKEVQGVRIGMIGATTQMTPRWDEQQLTKGVLFESAAVTVRHWVKHLREVEQVDVVVVAYHGGFSESIVSDFNFCANAIENEGNALLALNGIDVLITGHQHLEICTKVGNTVVVQPGANGDCYAKISIDLERAAVDAELVPLAKNDWYPDEVTHWLQAKIGESTSDFRYEGLLASRLASHPFVDFVHEVQLSYAQTDISIVDLLYYETGGFTGEITNGDIVQTMSRPNVLQKMSLTGLEIKSFLEQVAATFALNRLGDIDFSYNVSPESNPPFLYFFVGGLDYTIALDRPVGQRVVQCDFRGKPIEDEMNYSVCLNSYLATGADFAMFQQKETVTISEEIIPLLLIRYIENNSPITAKSNGQFRVLKSFGE